MEGVEVTHYVNPYTGKYTQLTVAVAIRKLQSLARKFLLHPIKMPLKEFLKAGRIYLAAAKAYDANRKSLAAVINMAICMHVVDHEVRGAVVCVSCLCLAFLCCISLFLSFPIFS